MNIKKSVAIFASGAGSNAEKIIERFKASDAATISLIATNKTTAGVISIAERNDIPVLYLNKQKFFEEDGYVEELRQAKIDLIVLAGFLWKIPQIVIDAFRNRIINIHPALLPKYGGTGMYGSKVHEAVISNGETESGITIHYVDEHYDNGDIIFHAACPVLKTDTADSLAEKIHSLEHKNYPEVILNVVSRMVERERQA